MESYMVGTCERMCPEPERKLRTKEKLLHFYEVESDKKDERIVKCFTRSAAGIKSPINSNLRTYNAMKYTISYLINEILADTRKPYHFKFDFVFDRLRAIRQEMVMQNLDVSKTIPLLEPIIMFLAYSSYRLCGEEVRNYDPKLNHQHLLECLKKILCCYDAIDEKQEKNRNRAYIEAIYLLCSLGRTTADIAFALHRAVSVQKSIDHKVFNISLKIALNFWQNNYHRCFQESRKLPHILLAIFSLNFQVMRRYVLLTFSHAFNSKTLTVPIDSVKSILHYTTRTQTVEALQYYNLTVVDACNVNFGKHQFDVKKPTMQSKSEDCVENNFLNVDWPKLILMANLDEY